MLKQQSKLKNQKGFTIIEVLIVLAIAGLIMVVVFLAVPALQRSQRNNALSSDANNVFSAVGNFVSDDNGTVPANGQGSYATGKVTVGTSGTTNVENATVSANTTGFSVVTTAPSATTLSSDNVGTMVLVTQAAGVCNATKSGLSGTGTTRSFALVYVSDGGSGSKDIKCIDNN